MSTSPAWDELVTAATVGTSSRALPTDGFHPLVAPWVAGLSEHGADPAVAVLDLVALEAVTVGGGSSRSGAIPVGVAPTETRPEMSVALAVLLLRSTQTDLQLGHALLEEVARAGLVVPVSHLTAFLGLAGDWDTSGAMPHLVGSRGRWLIDLDHDWERVLAPAVPQVDDPFAESETWQTGSPAKRLAVLAAGRKLDPSRARQLLDQGWGDQAMKGQGWDKESGAERASLLAALGEGLAPGDGAFLERALDDRRADVRATARSLLVRLADRRSTPAADAEHTAFARRMTERARPLVRLASPGMLRQASLRVDAPQSLDASAARDGILEDPPAHPPGPAHPPSPPHLPAPSPRGRRAWWLEQVLTATPLAFWGRELGRSPADLWRLPVSGDYEPEWRRGIRAAAIAQRDTGWAEVILAGPDGVVDSELGALLSGPQRSVWAARVVGAGRPDATGRLQLPLEVLLTVPGPWATEVDQAVRALLTRCLSTPYAYSATELFRLAALRLPVRSAAPETPDARRGSAEVWADGVARGLAADDPWRRPASDLAAALDLRARVHDKLTRSLP